MLTADMGLHDESAGCIYDKTRIARVLLTSKDDLGSGVCHVEGAIPLMIVDAVQLYRGGVP